jgi:hypothetical protein
MSAREFRECLRAQARHVWRSTRWAICLALAAAAGGCGAAVEVAPASEYIIVGPSLLSLSVGDSAKVLARLISADGQEGDATVVSWSSSDPSVATPSANGTVTALRPGSTQIVASHGAARATVWVNVISPTYSGATFTVSIPRSVLWVDDTLSAVAQARIGGTPMLPAPTIRWSTSRPDVVEVSALGVLRGVAPGVSTITAETGALSAILTITVVAIGELHVEGAQEVAPGWEAPLALRGPSGETFAGSAQWSSSDSTILTISSAGVVKALRSGAATVRASAAGQARELVVTVRALAGRIVIARDGALTLISLDESQSVVVPQRDGAPLTWPNMSVSPDGRDVAYDCGASVCTAPLDASRRPEVLFAKGTFPSWSADGKTIAVRTDYAEIGVLDVATGALTRIKAIRYVDRPHLSPDARNVAYDCDFSNPYDSLDDTCISPAGGAQGSVLVPYGTGTVWSPDGGRIAYRAKDGVCVASATPLPTCTLVLPATAENGWMEITWSPDGMHLLVARGHELVIVDPDGRNRTRQISSAYGFTGPSWVPSP